MLLLSTHMFMLVTMVIKYLNKWRPQSSLLSSLIAHMDTIFKYSFTIFWFGFFRHFVFTQLIWTSDSVQNLAVRLVLEEVQQTLLVWS